MLRLHFLNVDHGDSIIIEHIGDDGIHYALIDSNQQGRGAPPALRKLQELGAERLSFIMLTHPHRDHFRGLSQILRAYHGKIGDFFVFPLGEFIPSRIRSLARQYLELCKRQDDEETTRAAEEFVDILLYLYKNMRGKLNQFSGEKVTLLPSEGFNSVDLFTISPPNQAKGHYFKQIKENDPTIVEDTKHNDLSIAVLLQMAGVEVVLGGDVTASNWQYHRLRNRNSDDVLNASVVKIPHHGSRVDANPHVLKYLFADNGRRLGIISANGQSHPSEEVIETLEEKGIEPYCTNLIPKCGANVRQLINVGGIDPELGRFINYYQGGSARVQPCQGDITVTIGDNGAVSVRRQFELPCGFRGDFEKLFPGM
jgi:beta-lactamase superfamily II metal-dependent hydrolase